MRIMKIRILYVLALMFLSYGCENSENEFDDFDTQNVYFPIQYPVRTISLQEDSRVDNSIDLERAFSIGVTVGGLRSNDKNRVVNIALAPELVTNAYLDASGTQPVMLMPSNYYTIASTEITIPKGSLTGTVRVDLTDDFFADPMSITTNYVIPLVITSSNTTGVLTGVAANGVVDPDRRVSADWEAGYLPKDFTMFGVKFINKYHGKYLQKGQDDTLDGMNGNVVSSEIYNTKFIENNLLTDVLTLGVNQSTSNRMGINAGSSNTLVLDIALDGSIVISNAEGSLPADGVGKFVSRDDSSAESWGGEPRKTMFLDYTYQDGGVYHQVKDTLVFRNDEIKFELFSVAVVEVP